MRRYIRVMPYWIWDAPNGELLRYFGRYDVVLCMCGLHDAEEGDWVRPRIRSVMPGNRNLALWQRRN